MVSEGLLKTLISKHKPVSPGGEEWVCEYERD